MRLSIIILLLFLFAGSLQAQGPLDTRVTYTAANQPLASVLLELSDQADVNITFSNSLVAGISVSVRASGQRLGDVLTGLLMPYDLGITMAGNVIVLVPAAPPPRYTIRGYLTDARSGEPLIGANVYLSGSSRGTTTNDYGFYSLTLETGSWTIITSYLGYQRRTFTVDLSSDQRLSIELEPSLTLKEVVVTAATSEPDLNLGSISRHQFRVDDLEKLPTLGGEVDVLRTSYLVPGVQTGADGFGGISVRGGNVDQNLYLLDGVPVYNATHLLGVYSVFNSSAVHSSTLYKGVLPARYGGRASSVLDVRTREGNLKESRLAVDAGLTSGKFTIEGPIRDGNSSFIITGRRSFIDFYSRPISRQIRDANDINGELGYFFYDFNAKINITVGQRDRFFLSFYNGGDDYANSEQVVDASTDTVRLEDARQSLKWGNTIASFRWNHLFGNRLFLNTTLTFSRFFYQSQEVLDLASFVNGLAVSRDYLFYQYASNNRDLAAKLDFDFSPNPTHYLRFGLNFTRHRFQPGAVVFDETNQVDTISQESLGLLLEKNPLFSDELDLYIEDEIQLGERLWINAGARLTTLFVEQSMHLSLQPRLQLRYRLAGSVELRAAAGKATQNLHLLSNSGIGLPRDLWVSATDRVDPVHSWQYTLGTGWSPGEDWAFLVEGYYKSMDNLLAFRESVLANIDGTNWQNLVITGSGRAYGLEFLAEKKTGPLSGWVSYTLGYADRTFAEDNFGQTFPFKLDRRHNLSLALLYTFSPKWSLSATFAFRSGENTTLPRASYFFNQLNLLYSDFPPQFPFVLEAFDNGEKNGIKLPPYHRLDLNLQYRFERPRSTHTFNLGVYNAYLRRNPWYYSLVRRPDENGDPQLQYVQYSFIPFLPSLRYRIEFFSGR